MMLKYSNAKIVAQYLPRHSADVHKYQRGKVLAWCGSDAMRGAASLCAKAAFMAGAGYVQVFTEEAAAAALAINLPEAVTCSSTTGDFSDCFKLAARNSRSIMLGPGIGVNPTNSVKMEGIFKTALLPILVDADALTMLADNPAVLKTAYTAPIITPHTGEMAKLAGLPLQTIIANRNEIAVKFAQEYNCCVVLKGAQTVVAAANGIVIVNPHSNAKLATAGSGDVLTGIIAALLAQGVDSYFAAVCGCFIHGEAGEIASKSGKRNIIASSINECIAKTIETIEKCTAN